MKRITRIGSKLRFTSSVHRHVRPFQQTSAASSSPATKDGASHKGDATQVQPASQTADTSAPPSPSEKSAESSSAIKKKKTVAEMDEELRVKLEGMSGEGGSAGIEYEGGKAEGLKRGVKSNMFRVI